MIKKVVFLPILKFKIAKSMLIIKIVKFLPVIPVKMNILQPKEMKMETF